MLENLELMKHISWIFSGVGNIFLEKIIHPSQKESQIGIQSNFQPEIEEIKEDIN